MKRYIIVPSRDASLKFSIWDSDLKEECSLVDPFGEVKPLRWRTHIGADTWLTMCYSLWARWETTGEGSPPSNWRPSQRLNMDIRYRAHRYL